MARHFLHLIVRKISSTIYNALYFYTYISYTKINQLINSTNITGSPSSINLSGLVGSFPARTVLMIVGSFTVVLTVVAVSIGVICRIQFRSVPSSSPPCVIQRINNGSRSSAHSQNGSYEGDIGKDKRIVLLSINGGRSSLNLSYIWFFNPCSLERIYY